jgi:hypothetical protein
MWRILITLLILTGAVAAGKTTLGQAPREPYGPFDAIAEGTRNNESRRLSLIDAQLDTVDALGALRLAQFRRPWGPDVAAVYPYGRRGILGLRPRGYVVVRRAPAVAYRGAYLTPPPPPDVGYNLYGGDPAGQPVRQPIGHESLQTGPNRWEYRPLYAGDDGRLDEMHGQIERNLRPDESELGSDREGAVGRNTRRAGDRAATGEPEELPVPRDDVARDARPPAPARGQARDIARSAAFAEQRNDRATRRQTGDANLRNLRPPPPPRPDPAAQPITAPEKRAPVNDDAELRGPLLQNPATGTREF